MFHCQEHQPDEGPGSASGDPFRSLISISLLDTFTHSYWGLDLRCLHTSIFIATPSLEGLPTKAKGDPSPHEMRLSPTGYQPSISWSRADYYYYYYIVYIFLNFILKIRKYSVLVYEYRFVEHFVI